MADPQNIPIPQGATIGQPIPQNASVGTPASGAVPIPAGASIGHPNNPPVGQDRGVLDKVQDTAEKVVDTVPGVGTIHQLAGAAEDWASRKLDPSQPKLVSPTKTAGLGILRDTAGLVHGVTSPAGLATMGAGIIAPEIVGPAMAAHGIHSLISGWGDLRNPDVLQKELNAGAEIAGGAASTGETLRTGGGPIPQSIRENAAKNALANAPSQQIADFKSAIPPSKPAPYTDVDYHMARPYLEAEHATGNSIDSPVGLRDAADSAVSKIEGRIASEIQNRPNIRVSTNPVGDAYTALKDSVRTDFLEAGMKELENYPLGFQRANGVVDPPLTLRTADDIRWQLNQDNKAVLARNNYDIATARATDPGFAAREAAAESLRTGIYDGLERDGFTGARQLRLDEGSLLKIRNASLRQEFNGEKAVRPTATTGPRKTAAGAVKKVATGAGAALGAKVAGVPGAVVGAEIGSSVGESAANRIAPGPLSRNNLLDRSFRPTPVVNPARVTSQSAAANVAGGSAANEGRIFFQASDGSTHSVTDHAGLEAARQVDPNLRIIELGARTTE